MFCQYCYGSCEENLEVCLLVDENKPFSLRRDYYKKRVKHFIKAALKLDFRPQQIEDYANLGARYNYISPEERDKIIQDLHKEVERLQRFLSAKQRILGRLGR